MVGAEAAVTPIFAVVGHPNKGKSSIVATLAEDESVRISPEPGTTERCRRYPMRVDGETLYTLVDTPGFQRARRVLAWLREHETTAAERPAIVRRFAVAHRDDAVFRNECELLEPVLAGAGILYVVDGSRPYGAEYEAEMEILRWTGQPAMGLINMIGPGDFVEQWTTALGQYFGIVRRFDALTAEFDRRIELLRAFGQLKPEWHENLERAVGGLLADRRQRNRRAALALAEMLIDVLALRVSKRVSSDADVDSLKRPLLTHYQARLRERERGCWSAVEHIYGHYRLKRRATELEGVEGDLFSASTWSLFGLTRRQLLASGALGGAAVGGGVDALTGGASLLLGAGIGALVGGASAWYSYQRIAKTRVFGLPLGGVELQVGPMTSRNLPYVILGRALFHHAVVSRRSHASRDRLDLERMAVAAGARHLDAEARKSLEGLFARVRRGGRSAVSAREFGQVLEPLLGNERDRYR